jgi:hypothetical protein
MVRRLADAQGSCHRHLLMNNPALSNAIQVTSEQTFSLPSLEEIKPFGHVNDVGRFQTELLAFLAVQDFFEV